LSKKRKNKNKYKDTRFYGNDVVSHYAKRKDTASSEQIKSLALQVFGSLYIDSSSF
jgi:extradiol dioxygenase family protein